MEKQSNNYCVILAGGNGRRLWPSSRNVRPKQFVDFFGSGRTQLQSTFDRMARIIPVENIFVTTRQMYSDLTREQLPELPAENVLAEPVNRNTAPSVAWAGLRIQRQRSDARVIIVPSDQIIVGEEAFYENVTRGLDFVADNDIFLTMGVRPTRPEPGYGYIQVGESTLVAGINKVQSFTEKPERDFARIFMESGEFFWNTGMFLSNVRHLQQFFIDTAQEISGRMPQMAAISSLQDELDYVQAYFASYPNLSMDKAVLEMSDSGYLMCCDFGWADLGTWHSIYEFKQRCDGDNVVIDSEVLMENCKGNIVKLPKGHVGVINGLDGYIVAEQSDVLLICKKGDSSALIRKYVSEVGIRFGEEYE